MMAIQIIVAVVAVSIILYVLGSGQTYTARAWKKIGICLLALAMIIAAIFPEFTNIVAHSVGVGRGADLLLYILTLAFISYVVNSYQNQQKEKDKLYRLARKIALVEANERYNIHK